MAIQFEEIGLRLRAYRLGKNLTAEEIAAEIGISRAAVYRLEKGEIVKIQTLDALSELLEVSLPSLLGVGVEYYNNAISFFERMRQLEEKATHVLGNFAPVSSLLLSDDYMGYLRLMLIEAIPEDHPDTPGEITYIDTVLDILNQRRASAAKRRVPIVSVVGTQDVERMLHFGLVGKFDLPDKVKKERRAAASREIERLIDLMERQPIGLQIGVVDGMPPAQTFQIFEKPDAPAVTLSPYRLGDQANISSGIALATSAPEAVRSFEEILARQWQIAKKGSAAADRFRTILAQRRDD
ncbi:helix-turn-helix transcriptional regulator [Devosia sp. 2618]|uniref:helix-turn-helix domain-containing protein n=1 Tax=Devosia sp. 2618 TaxID=3156454 RepID=UPI00339A6BF5